MGLVPVSCTAEPNLLCIFSTVRDENKESSNDSSFVMARLMKLLIVTITSR